jgi:hypothetical protein
MLELPGELGDALLDLCVRTLIGVDPRTRFGQRRARLLVEVVEPIRDHASGLEDRRGRDGGGEVAAHAGGGGDGAVGGEDLLEHVDGVAQVVAVGDSQDQVLVLAAGGSDIQPAASGGRGGEGEAACGRVGLVAGFGCGVPESDVVTHVLGWQSDGMLARRSAPRRQVCVVAMALLQITRSCYVNFTTQ